MKHKTFAGQIGLGLLLLLSLLARSAAAQASFPPADAQVNDVIGLLHPEDLERMEQAAAHAGHRYRIEVVVVLIDRVDAYDSGQSIERFARELFDHRGIGDPELHDGVLVLLATEDRAVRIELGQGYGQRYDHAVQQLVDRKVVPHFRNGEWADGVFAAIEGIGPLVSAPPPAAPQTRPRATRKPNRKQKARKSDQSALFELLLWLGGVSVALFGLVAAGRQLLRNRAVACPRCGQKMVRLDEIGDDEYLNEGQQAEEVIGTVDYDVWLCRACAETVTRSYASWFVHRSPCPDCGYKTLSSNERTLEAATRYSTGLRQITQSCLSCDYESEWTETIPQLPAFDDDDSWSSSGSSFSGGGGGGGGGGGVSGGGGATGRW